MLAKVLGTVVVETEALAKVLDEVVGSCFVTEGLVSLKEVFWI